ncbi:MAG TPA: S-layer homology domain-containing protein, partial [Candidatus Elarobacter sp.]|nr:S-layer homology domain-containing protein [Candidatus Elarobacter sp.]
MLRAREEKDNVHWSRVARFGGTVAFTAAVVSLYLSPALAQTASTGPAAAPPDAGAAVSQAPAPNPFADVPRNSWAYDAVRKLLADNLIQGYPDGQFKGSRPLTRYEMAVIVSRLETEIQTRLGSHTDAATVTPEQLAAMRKLVDEFGPELARLTALEKRVDTLDGQVKKNTSDLARQQFHATYFLRGPGLFNDRVTAVNGRGTLTTANGAVVSAARNAVLPPGIHFTTGEMPGLIGQNALTSGLTDHGTAYQVARIAWGGNFDKYFSYGFRLENREFFDNPQGSTSTSTPNYCTSAACSTVFVAASSAPVRLNYSWLKYTSPGAFSVQVGSFFGNESKGLGLAYTNYIDGIQLGYKPKRRPLEIEGGYGVGDASGSNTIPGYRNETQQQI